VHLKIVVVVVVVVVAFICTDILCWGDCRLDFKALAKQSF
jgi:hypothetical protein